MKHITKAVDQIAALSAQIAELNDHKKALIESLKAEGEGRYCGTEHYLTVSVSERATLDMSAVRKKLSRQFIASHTRVTEVVTASLKGYNKDRRVA